MGTSILTNAPRANKSTQELERRRKALALPHMLPLVSYVTKLRQQYANAEVPDFDPLGGGIEADVLFLLEKPGPKTSQRGGGSGFISICNNDPTAEAMWHFLNQAAIPVHRTIMWNTIPEWDGTRKYYSSDVKRGLSHLDGLLCILPRVHTVVTLGIPARKAESIIKQRGLHHLVSDHPGPMVRAKYPERWSRIPEVWKMIPRQP